MKNKRGITLLELIVYIGILLVVLPIVYNIVTYSYGINLRAGFNSKLVSDITNTDLILDKTLNGVNNIFLLSHTEANTPTELANIFFTTGNNNKDSQYLNQHEFTIAELKAKCGFTADNNYDLVAFTSRSSLDPIIVGVIEKVESDGRTYKQLAVYKYRSLSDTDGLKKDRELYITNPALGISNFLDDRGRYKTEGLTDWKCDVKNGYLVPISSKYYQGSNQGEENNQINIKSFKVLTETDLDNIVKYGQGYVEFVISWSLRDGSNNGTKEVIHHQIIGKEFTY